MKLEHIRTVQELSEAGLGAFDIEQVFKLTRRIQRFAVKELYEPVTDAERRRQNIAVRKLKEICHPHSIGVDTFGDPRGFVVGLRLPSGEWNGADPRDGWRIDPDA